MAKKKFFGKEGADAEEAAEQSAQPEGQAEQAQPKPKAPVTASSGSGDKHQHRKFDKFKRGT